MSEIIDIVKINFLNDSIEDKLAISEMKNFKRSFKNNEIFRGKDEDFTQSFIEALNGLLDFTRGLLFSLGRKTNGINMQDYFIDFEEGEDAQEFLHNYVFSNFTFEAEKNKVTLIIHIYNVKEQKKKRNLENF